MDPGSFTNFSPAPTNGALNILLLDTLNTPLQDQAYARAQILKFLKSSPPGVPMAIFGFNSQLRLLQGFTSDPQILRDAIAGKKYVTQGSSLFNNPTTGDGASSPTPYQSVMDALGNSPGSETISANLAQFQAQLDAQMLILRARYTLDAFNQLARYLSRLPGRKNLIWFSGSFPLNILPNPDLKSPFEAQASMEDEFRETVNLLSLSQVAVYPVDARGLMNSPAFDASVGGVSANTASKKGYADGAAFNKAQQKFFEDTAAEHGTMLAMAEQTGGKAYFNTNGLTEAVANAVSSGGNYYTLAYSPANKEWKGEFRKIEVKLAQQGYTLDYRRGYYANADDALATHKIEPAASTSAAAPAGTYDAMRSAMLWGGPDPTEILFRASIAPASTTAETDVAPGNHAEAKAKPPYQRYNITFAADPKDITFTAGPKDTKHVSLEFITFVYNADGALITSKGDKLTADLSADRYAAIRHGGVQFRQEISVPIKGEYFLRVGIHDLATDHVGALELPVSAVSHLKPAGP
jgi:VWFA-related protein